MVEIKEEKTS